MTTPTPRIRAARGLLAAIALGAVLFTGCTADPQGPAATPPAGDGQTAATACDLVREGVDDAAAQLQSLDTSDPQAAFEVMSRVATQLGEAAAEVTNAEVAALLPDLQDGFASAADVLRAIAGGDLSQVPALQVAAMDIQDAFGAFAKVCTTP